MSDNYVPNFEDRYYEVHPRNLGWAMHQLGAMPGYNVQGYAQGKGGMYIIVVQVPFGAPQADWRDAPPAPRRVRFEISQRMIAVLVAVVLLVGVVGYAVYSGFTVPTWDEIAQGIHMPEPITQMFEPPKPRGEPVVEKSGWHWPWESSVVSKPQQQEGFRWPWQDAQDAAGEMVESVKMAGLMIVGLFLVLGSLWVVGIVRGAIGK